MQTLPLFEFTHVSKQFASNDTSHPAVIDANFKIYPGEMLGLLGESGCGKSTTAKMLLGLLKPSSGTITYQQQVINHLSARKLRPLRRQLQLIPQNPFTSLDPALKVEQTLLEPLRIWHIGKNQQERLALITETLTACGLDPTCLTKYPQEFSGGQLQRLAIARALLVKPQFIVADEIVSALDVAVQSQILTLLLELKQSYGLTLLFITHDLRVMQQIADRVLVMRAGKIIQTGNVKEILRHPKNEYVRELFDAAYTF